ncbi:hypothetical protein [Sphingomonas sp.]|uniref:hypothetical protein n=1 Tax=Sphingomonas sp. TaxID=28214 RepID=UPI0025FBFCC4|nr:hypothetical protein [Sphingomonas sp.]MBV9528251.1 hypothetical protein [Sphingomonas sp.]
MRVYHHSRASHTLYVTPAADPRAAPGGHDADWTDDDGKPRMLIVQFVDGVAEVPDALGRYLLATKQAKRTTLFMPRFAAA